MEGLLERAHVDIATVRVRLERVRSDPPSAANSASKRLVVVVEDIIEGKFN